MNSIPNTLMHTLYHMNSRGLETSYNVLDARDYIKWFCRTSYGYVPNGENTALFQ